MMSLTGLPLLVLSLAGEARIFICKNALSWCSAILGTSGRDTKRRQGNPKTIRRYPSRSIRLSRWCRAPIWPHCQTVPSWVHHQWGLVVPGRFCQLEQKYPRLKIALVQGGVHVLCQRLGKCKPRKLILDGGRVQLHRSML